MSNTSATGGYLTPTSSEGFPGGITLTQFIQTVIVGISGYPDTLVRPKWQVAPPKQPDISTDWIAFAVSVFSPDANAYVWLDDQNVTNLSRHETLEIQCAFYGNNAISNIGAFRDGFQLQQNLEAMGSVNMGFAGVSQIIRGPDLINERFVERLEMSLFLRRQVMRVYPILSFASASGIIHTIVNSEELNVGWSVEGP